MATYTVTLQHDPESDDVILPLPQEVCDSLKVKEGDTLNWAVQDDGTIVMTKQETELVLVSTVQTFRVDYVIEVPKGKTEYALDTASFAENCTEFHQEYIGDQIFNHRVVSESEVCDMFRANNKEIVISVKDATIIEKFVTRE